MAYTTIDNVREDKAIDASFSDAEITAAIEGVTEDVNDWTGIAWQPTAVEETACGDGTRQLVLTNLYIRSVDSVLVGGVADSVVVSSFPGSRIERASGLWEVDKVYTFGLTVGKYATAPERLVSASTLETRVRLLAGRGNGVSPSHATQVNNEGGQYTFPNWSGKYGPFAHADLMRWANARRHRSRGYRV